MTKLFFNLSVALLVLASQAFASNVRNQEADALISTDHTKTWALPAAADTLTGRASTDTLTNKSISGSSNTLTNISLTASVTGILPVANATIATQSIASTGIDWSTGNVFKKTLSANTTFTFSNLKDGQTIVVELTNTASNYTVTFPTTSPANVFWVGGGGTAGANQPVQTTGAHTDIWTFIYNGTSIHGSVVQNY